MSSEPIRDAAEIALAKATGGVVNPEAWRWEAEAVIAAIRPMIEADTRADEADQSRGVIEALALEVMDLRAHLAHLRGVLVALGVTSLDGCDCPTCGALGGVR